MTITIHFLHLFSFTTPPTFYIDFLFFDPHAFTKKERTTKIQQNTFLFIKKRIKLDANINRGKKKIKRDFPWVFRPRLRWIIMFRRLCITERRRRNTYVSEKKKRELRWVREREDKEKRRQAQLINWRSVGWGSSLSLRVKVEGKNVDNIEKKIWKFVKSLHIYRDVWRKIKGWENQKNNELALQLIGLRVSHCLISKRLEQLSFSKIKEPLDKEVF